MLRFTSGSRSLDLLTWPAAWTEFTDAQLSELLGRAFPRDITHSNPTAHRRRSTDQGDRRTDRG